MKARFYDAVWIDFQHYFYEGQIAINVQESTEKGQPIWTHRLLLPASEPLPSEAEIVTRLLPGAIHHTKYEGK